MRISIGAIAAVAVFLSGAAMAADGAAIYRTNCASCHGPDALGNGTYPRLSGQHADYIVKQLGVFQRTDERPEGAVMKVVAHGLSETEFADVAAYLQALPGLPAAK